MNLIDVTKTFKSEDDALEFLETMRWPDGIRCPVCGNEKISKITRKTASKNKRSRIYQCLETTCRQQFSATSGTIYGDSHLPLTTWFMAIAFIVDAKKGMSAKQLQRHLGVTYKTAWYLCHRIRKAMEQDGEPLSGTVEIDETYVGGRVRGRGKSRAEAMANKHVVMGAIERGGDLRLRHVANDEAHTFRDFISTNVSPTVERIMTDQHRSYPPALKALKPRFSATHETVNHIDREYVRGDVTTNRIESAFSLFKRGIVGSFHKVSIKHLHRYLSEFEMRFNERENPERFELLVGRMCQTETMPYRRLIDGVSETRGTV